MDIIDCLREEHQRALTLVEQMDTLTSQEAISQLVVQLAQELSLHEQAEERAVWFTLRKALPDGTAIEDAMTEEDELKQYLEEMVMNLDHERLTAHVQRFRDLLMTHLETEQREIFPLVTRHIDRAERSRMAEAYISVKATLVEQMARLNIIMAPEAPLEQRLGSSEA